MVVAMSGMPMACAPKACVRADGHNSTMPKHQPRSDFVITPIEGKGLGWVASQAVEIGTRIHAEVPLLMLDNPRVNAHTHVASTHVLLDAFKALSPAAQQAFWDLSQNASRWPGAKTVEGIWMTNAMQTANGTSEAVFPTIARVNHSCESNAVYKWNGALGKMTVHAIKRIAPGDEITVSYGFRGSAMLRAQRQQRLRRQFGFDCACSKCRLSGAALAASEERLLLLGSDFNLGSFGDVVRGDPSWVLDRFEERYHATRLEVPDGHFYGVETIMQGFLQWTDETYSRLRQLLTRTKQISGASAAVVPISWPGQRPGEEFSLPRAEAEAKAAAYGAAARSWAARAHDVARDMVGEDAPTYQALSAALQRCWRMSEDEETYARATARWRVQ